jgi:hypothetical protein
MAGAGGAAPAAGACAATGNEANSPAVAIVMIVVRIEIS